MSCGEETLSETNLLIWVGPSPGESGNRTTVDEENLSQ